MLLCLCLLHLRKLRKIYDLSANEKNFTLSKNRNRLNGRLFGSAPREFHPHAVLARPYLLPATPRHLNMVARSGCSCKGVSLSCLCVVARKLPNLLHFLVFLARSQQIIYLREVVAHRPYGSSQTDRIRLPYAGRELSARRSCQGASAAREERGTHGCLLRFNSGQSPGWR